MHRRVVLRDFDVEPGRFVPEPFGQGAHVVIVRGKDREEWLVAHDGLLSFVTGGGGWQVCRGSLPREFPFPRPAPSLIPARLRMRQRCGRPC